MIQREVVGREACSGGPRRVLLSAGRGAGLADLPPLPCCRRGTGSGSPLSEAWEATPPSKLVTFRDYSYTPVLRG